MLRSLAFVGAGPTTLYTLQALLDARIEGAEITIFEAQPELGMGAPYRPGWNDPSMLANIASVEIPPVHETLSTWTTRQPIEALVELGVGPSDIGDRAFLPRLALGRYFRDQFDQLVSRARHLGVRVRARTSSRVLDVRNTQAGMRLAVAATGGGVSHETFDHVVLATGHQWPLRQSVHPEHYLTPWPAETLSRIEAADIGILGTSLTAIDTVVALASQRGTFVRENEDLAWKPNPDVGDFHITLMSRKGLLPEADFYFPLPHEPLSICTEAAIACAIKAGSQRLLDRVFDLIQRELLEVDPDYSARVGLGNLSVEAFAEAYFSQRSAADPFAWARANLQEAHRNHTACHTVPWRDALLRMHEPVAAIAPRLDDEDFARFNRLLKPVFVDIYAAVPHASIERLLALHEAGSLDIVALGDRYAIETDPSRPGVSVRTDSVTRHYPAFIEATGQRPLSAIQFPFLSLIEQGVVQDGPANDPVGASRGLLIDDAFRVTCETLPSDRLFCVSLPFILGRHPFAQGITSSHAMGRIVGEALANALRAATSRSTREIEEAA